MGIFFYPLNKEYCILWGSFAANPKPLIKMVDLSSNPSCKELNQSSLLQWRILCPKALVFIEEDAILYWMIKDDDLEKLSLKELIMAFDINSEEFSLIPHRVLAITTGIMRSTWT